MDSRTGAMYEINALVWPLVYGVAGHIWGTAVGHPWLGVLAGIVLGVATAAPMLTSMFYDVEIVAPFLLLGLLLVPVPMRRWYVLCICALPWLRLGLARVRRGRSEKPSEPTESPPGGA